MLSQPTFDCKVHMAMVAIMITSYAFSHLTSRQGLETYCFYTFGLTIHIVLMIFRVKYLLFWCKLCSPKPGAKPPEYKPPLHTQLSPFIKPHYPSPIHSVREHRSECILNNIQKLSLLSSSQSNHCQRLDLTSTTIGFHYYFCGFLRVSPCC